MANAASKIVLVMDLVGSRKLGPEFRSRPGRLKDRPLRSEGRAFARRGFTLSVDYLLWRLVRRRGWCFLRCTWLRRLDVIDRPWFSNRRDMRLRLRWL